MLACRRFSRQDEEKMQTNHHHHLTFGYTKTTNNYKNDQQDRTLQEIWR